MSFLRGSTNYVWCTTSVLGFVCFIYILDFSFVIILLHQRTQYLFNESFVIFRKGATGAVFQGVNKHNGEPVAVKTFNQVKNIIS